MSVLIKGMEMPKDCDDCRFHKSYYCVLTDIITNGMQGCPLVEVPPHGRLVDADELKATFCAECNHTLTCEDCDIDYHIGRLAPIIIESEEGESHDQN